jgi:NAD(P)-dependent dehydrogenase (short-subunit alcohol dehydrogenase family)
VLITGAGRGFGRELLEVYLGRGWTVFPLVRDRVAAGLDPAPACHPIEADVASNEVGGAIAAVLEAHGGKLDLLINNAGNIRKHRDLASTSPEDLLDHFQVHCAGAFRCIKGALPFLQQAADPCIVNISSRWGSIARTAAGNGCGIYAYQVAKTAQNMLSACLHQEFGGSGIRIHAVHPGRLRTEVGAADADVDPREAAVRLADWIDGDGRGAGFEFHDLMDGGRIDW